MRCGEEEDRADSLSKRIVLFKLSGEDVSPLCDETAQAVADKDDRILSAVLAYFISEAHLETRG
jgi:hypothetical protein